MSRIKWDQTGERTYETGVSMGVLYKKTNGTYGKGVPWNGLSAVNENPSGAEPSPVYADNIKYLNLMSAEEFGATIEAYTYPDEWAECDGSASLAEGVYISQQPRATFALCYRTNIGNDVDGSSHGYKLHIVYEGLASPSGKNYSSINETPEAMTMSWEITTTPIPVTGHKPTAHLTIDSTKVDPEVLAEIEDILYGLDASAEGVTPAVAATEPALLLPDEIIALLTPAGTQQ